VPCQGRGRAAGTPESGCHKDVTSAPGGGKNKAVPNQPRADVPGPVESARIEAFLALERRVERALGNAFSNSC